MPEKFSLVEDITVWCQSSRRSTRTGETSITPWPLSRRAQWSTSSPSRTSVAPKPVSPRCLFHQPLNHCYVPITFSVLHLKKLFPILIKLSTFLDQCAKKCLLKFIPGRQLGRLDNPNTPLVQERRDGRRRLQQPRQVRNRVLRHKLRCQLTPGQIQSSW